MSDSTSEYVPERGDFVWIDFSPQAGHEQAGRRPGLVLSRQSYNRRTGRALICPVTRSSKGYPFEVPVLGALGVTGFILADHINNMDWRSRHTEFLATAPESLLNRTVSLSRRLLEDS